MRGKSQQLQIRVAAAEKKAIQKAAAQAGMDMSGWVLSKLFPPGALRFQELVSALATDAASARLILGELNDFLKELTGPAFVAAVVGLPVNLPDDYLANYVAAMVETAAYQKGVRPPEWTATVPPLSRPAFATELLSLRLHLLLASPPAFRRRNLFVDATIGDRV